MDRQVTVLVTCAGSAPAQAFIRALKSQTDLEVKLVGTDTVPRSAGLFDCDAAYTVPRVDDPCFLEAIEAICRAEDVDIVVPIAQFELELFAGAADRLRSGTGAHVISNSPEAVALALDKRASVMAVAAAGVTVPEIHELDRGAEPRLPAIVKPANGAGSVGITVVRDFEELPAALRAAGPRPVVQDFIEGEEYTVDLVVAPDGEVLAAAPRIRVEVRAGQSYKSVTVEDPEISEAARRCAQALGITAQANVQLIKRRTDGRPYFVECNAKFAAAMGLAIGAGLNIPLLYVKLALGMEVKPEELQWRKGMWLLRSWNDRVVAEEAIAAVPSWELARSRAKRAV
jgi:carbamoyl-phosphate synthase large subunit